MCTYREVESVQENSFKPSDCCDLCGVTICDESLGQRTADTILCLGCLESVIRKDTYGKDW